MRIKLRLKGFDHTPDKGLPVRLLREYREVVRQYYLTSTTGYWECDADVIENDKRLKVLDKAIKTLGGK